MEHLCVSLCALTGGYHLSRCRSFAKARDAESRAHTHILGLFRNYLCAHIQLKVHLVRPVGRVFVLSVGQVDRIIEEGNCARGTKEAD